MPNKTNMKLPEMPGRIIAQMAMTPHKKINAKLVGVLAGVAIVI